MFKRNKGKNQYHVYITTNTYRGMILEVGRHPNNESIIQMPGLRIGNNFYFDVVSDSGINAIYTPTCCEKDHVYADHLSTRIAENYDFSKGKMTVSQVHRHPDGCIHFSSGDFEANCNLAKQYGGVVNGLMFVDPEFRLKFWYIDENGKETEAEYEINDRAVMEAMPFVKIEKIKSEVEKREALKKTCENDKLDEDMDFATSIEDMKPFKVLIPEEFRKQEYEGTLIGYYIPETKTYNILRRSGKPEAGAVRLGTACRLDHSLARYDNGLFPTLYIFWNCGEPEIVIGNDKKNSDVEIEYYSAEADIFSRNEGITECSMMKNKQVILVGAGSGGFNIGLNMVRAGVGSVLVADDDIMAYHNIARHECGIHDVGRYKVDCFKERAADINQDCKVYTFRDLIQHIDPEMLEDSIWKDSVIICCADNRHCAYICNDLADRYNIPFIDAGCGPRASTGEVFYYKPNCNMPCYTCTYGEDKGVDYNNQAIRRQFYATEKELQRMTFQPGMYMDIEIVALFTAKLAVDLLMEKEKDYQLKLLPYITQCTILLNYPVDKEINPYMNIFNEDILKPFTWKSVLTRKDAECSNCGTK